MVSQLMTLSYKDFQGFAAHATFVPDEAGGEEAGKTGAGWHNGTVEWVLFEQN